MARISRDPSSDDDIQISEFTVELNSDELVFDEEVGEDFDAIVVVKAIDGNLTSFVEGPAEELYADDNGGKVLSVSNEGHSRFLLGLTSDGYSKVKVFLGKIRKAAARAANTIPCTLCKKAVAQSCLDSSSLPVCHPWLGPCLDLT